MNKKLKIFGLLTSAAGFIIGLVANAIEDKKMEAAVDEAVTRRLEAAQNNTETVETEEESPITTVTRQSGEKVGIFGGGEILFAPIS